MGDEKQDTIAHIVAEMRGKEFDDPHLNADGIIGARRLARGWADRIEAAWNRERPQPDPEWEFICERCRDGDLEPDCEYYGEPNGCNSPIYGEHPKANPAGNAAEMREALELAIKVGDWCCSHTDDPLECCEYSCIYQVEPHGEAGADCPWKKIRAALAAPPRNCDVGTPEEQSKRYGAYCAEFGRHSDGSPKCIGCPLETRAMKIGGMCELAWAQMPYEAKQKGENDGSK